MKRKGKKTTFPAVTNGGTAITSTVDTFKGIVDLQYALRKYRSTSYHAHLPLPSPESLQPHIKLLPLQPKCHSSLASDGASLPTPGHICHMVPR